ncbi:MAG: hypothetical protein ABI855_19995, partial [Bacteroidota bacterium]
GYSSFSNQEPFDASLFVEFRKRLGIEQINTINEKILGLRSEKKEHQEIKELEKQQDNAANKESETAPAATISADAVPLTHKGRLIADATACPQDISYPTDLNLLNDAREKSEELIDVLFVSGRQLDKNKPRTYREKARKLYLNTAQKKSKSLNAHICFIIRAPIATRGLMPSAPVSVLCICC